MAPFLANDSGAPSDVPQGVGMHKKLLAAVAIVLTLLNAGRLPEVDDLLERVPTAVRSATSS